jgi:hypothetical protein
MVAFKFYLYHYTEELLFVYGFVEKNNPHDALVLQAPWTHANDFPAAAASKKNKNKKVVEPAMVGLYNLYLCSSTTHS